MGTKWLRVVEAAEYLKMGRSTVYESLREGRLPAHKAGGAWRFDAKELDEYVKAGKLSLPENSKARKKR